jgi:hypothetical protein
MQIEAAQEGTQKRPALAGRPALANLTNLRAQPLFLQPSRPASYTSSGWFSCSSSYAASIGASPVPPPSQRCLSRSAALVSSPTPRPCGGATRAASSPPPRPRPPRCRPWRPHTPHRRPRPRLPHPHPLWRARNREWVAVSGAESDLVYPDSTTRATLSSCAAARRGAAHVIAAVHPPPAHPT